MNEARPSAELATAIEAGERFPTHRFAALRIEDLGQSFGLDRIVERHFQRGILMKGARGARFVGQIGP